MIDWHDLGSEKLGLVVEGIRDEAVITAFLNAGEQAGRWSGWRGRLAVIQTGGIEEVYKELDRLEWQGRVFGLIDRDWRPDRETDRLRNQYSNRLLILPRIHIDNYFIDPDELMAMFPPAKRANFTSILSAIAQRVPDWTKQGAMAKALWESGAEEFCSRGGYKLLRRVPIPTDNAIRQHLQSIHEQIEPEKVFTSYKGFLKQFEAMPSPYPLCISGKLFFRQVIVPELNRHDQVRDESGWMDTLLENPLADCPSDLAVLLAPLVT